jgi:DNA-binding transcriptional LysR family regulator
MEMQQVRYFLALAATRNFTRAAEQCHVSQPALTRAIKALEDELGGELIRREGRLSHLTELGRRMEPLLRQCYEGASQAKALARAVQAGDLTTLTLAVSHTVAVELLLGVISELYRAFPSLQLKIRRGSAAEIARLLKDGEADVAVAGPLGESWERLEAWPMFTEAFELVLGAGHPLALRNEPTADLERLRDERFLVQVGGEMAEAQRDRLTAHGLPMEHAHEVETDRDMAALLEAGLGVAIAPASAPRSPGLRRLACPALDLHRTVCVYAVAGRKRSAETTTLLNLARTTDWNARLAGDEGR